MTAFLLKEIYESHIQLYIFILGLQLKQVYMIHSSLKKSLFI